MCPAYLRGISVFLVLYSTDLKNKLLSSILT
jgi:hypothetical protein